MKFDFAPDDQPLPIAPHLAALISSRPVLILGSTVQGEDEALLPEIEVFVQERNAFLIVAPRRPERFEIVAGLLSTTSLNFVRRSEISANSQRPTANVLLLDTIGELSRIYRFGTVAFVGGSLVRSGGHNPIEPAAAGIPVCFGPHMSNFREIAATFLHNDAAVEVRSPEALVEFAQRMFDDPAARRELGDRARRTVEENRGAAMRTAERIVELLA